MVDAEDTKTNPASEIQMRNKFDIWSITRNCMCRTATSKFLSDTLTLPRKLIQPCMCYKRKASTIIGTLMKIDCCQIRGLEFHDVRYIAWTSC